MFTDLDECAYDRACPDGFDCENTIGSFTCEKDLEKTRTRTRTVPVLIQKQQRNARRRRTLVKQLHEFQEMYLSTNYMKRK